jgi:hypothetical protein
MSERDAALQREQAACAELQSAEQQLDAALASAEEEHEELEQVVQRAALLSRAGCELGERLRASQLGAASLQLLNSVYRHENQLLRVRLEAASAECSEWHGRQAVWQQERETLAAQLNDAHAELATALPLDVATFEPAVEPRAPAQLDGLAEVLRAAAESRADLLADEVAALRHTQVEQREEATTLRLAISASTAEQERLASAAAERAVALERANREALRAVNAELQIAELQNAAAEVQREKSLLKDANKALLSKISNARAKEERWSDEVEE